jgi:hypothetical protein
MKNVRMAVKDIRLEVATEIGIELLKVGDTYYTVKNVATLTVFDTVLNTNDATERYTAREVMEMLERKGNK